ncbi:hypothetical protein BDV06DRAFT_217997 [Aspergillus oleicola]
MDQDSAPNRQHSICIPQCSCKTANNSNPQADKITLKGTRMMHGREMCAACGKPSSHDDVVHNALTQGIHSAEFMADVLRNGPENDSPSHVLYLSLWYEV